MRRAAIAAAFLGLIGSGLGCKATFGRCDCQNDASCQPLTAYAPPAPAVGPTVSSPTTVSTMSVPVVSVPTPGTLPDVPVKDAQK